jgi:hypothetical protein
MAAPAAAAGRALLQAGSNSTAIANAIAQAISSVSPSSIPAVGVWPAASSMRCTQALPQQPSAQSRTQRSKQVSIRRRAASSVLEPPAGMRALPAAELGY